MTNEEAIEALKRYPPAQPVSAWHRHLNIARNVAAVVAFVSFGLGLYSVHGEGEVAACVNTSVASRNGTSNGDAQAHIEFAKAISALTGSGDAATDRAEAFKRSLSKYIATLTADQVYRDAHPLGRC